MVKPLVAATLCMAIVACAAGGAKQAVAPPAQAPEAAGAAPSPMIDSPQTAEIERLSADIDKSRAQLGLDEPQIAAMPGPATPMSTVPQSTDASCKPAKTERCTSSCTLSDSICTNAARICELAKDLASDWAAGKCSRANQTCQAAHDSCCGCQ